MFISCCIEALMNECKCPNLVVRVEKTFSDEADDGWSRRTSLSAADQKGSSSALFYHQPTGSTSRAIPSAFARYLGSSFLRSLMTAASLRKEIAAIASTGRKYQI